jgi:hypothetical protein
MARGCVDELEVAWTAVIAAVATTVQRRRKEETLRSSSFARLPRDK